MSHSLGSIDPVTRHPKPLQPYIDEVKDFLEVSYPCLNIVAYLNFPTQDTRQKVLRRVLLLIDEVLGLEEGHLWRLHQDDQGRTGDDVRSPIALPLPSTLVIDLALQLLRYMIYDPLTSAEAQKTNGVMLNGHTDFNSISTLVSQPISALQILMPDGVWRYVKHKDGALVINIGDQLS